MSFLSSTKKILKFDLELIESSSSSSSLLSRVRVSQYLTRVVRELNQVDFESSSSIIIY